MLRSLFEKRSETFHVSQNPPGWVVKGLGWESLSGEAVSPDVALTVSAVWACVTILAESLASLPLILYQRETRGKTRASAYPLYPVLHDQPNDEHNAFTFYELLTGHVGTWGNAYAQIMRDNGGRVRQLWPLRPDRMKVDRVNGKKIFTYLKNGVEPLTFQKNEILHIQGFGSDGLTGLSPVAMARNSIGLAMSAEKYGSKVFQNDARPSVVLTTPKELKDPAYNRLKESWNEQFSGAGNAAKTTILEEGMDIKTIGFPPEDAQFLESRKFQLAEIARWYHMPLSLLSEQGQTSSYASVEQFSLNFVQYTLRPWLVRFEKSIAAQLLTPTERQDYFAEFLVDGLLRGDIATRYQAYNTGRNGGWLSVNDIRQFENMNPIDYGDEYLVPLNMAAAGQEPAPVDQPDQPIDQTGSQRAAFRPIIMDAATRIVRRETNDIRAQARKMLKNGEKSAFLAWIDQFYSDHDEFIARNLAPVAQSFQAIDAAFQPEFMPEKLKNWAEKRQNLLKTLLEIDQTGQLGALEAELDTWLEHYPAQLTEIFEG
jgi:HK97 family phage portal protein